MACSNGHIEIVKWLISIRPDIDISSKNDYAFLIACYNGNIEVAKWLCSLNKNTTLLL